MLNLAIRKCAVVRQCVPRPILDLQWVNVEWGGTLPDERWTDRLVLEENLIRCWQRVVQKFMEHSQTPFQVDAASLRRDDVPPDYLAFRESAINLLIHQDFADHNRKAAIQFFRDRTVLSNPGDLFADAEELLEPVESGAESSDCQRFSANRPERTSRNRISDNLPSLGSAWTGAAHRGERQREKDVLATPAQGIAVVGGATAVPGESGGSSE